MMQIQTTADDPQIKILLQTALAHFQKNEAALGESTLLSVLQTKPDEPDALQLLGLLRRAQGRLPEAEALYRRSLMMKPNQPQVQHNLATLLKATDRTDEAIAAFREAIRLKPNYAEAYLNMGIALADRENFAGAEKAYREALRLQPGFLMAKQSLVAALNSQGRPREAEQIARQALAQSTRRPRQTAALKHNLGVSLSAQRRHVEALRSFDEAQALVPEIPNTDRARANALQAMGRMDDAVESYKRAIARNPLDLAAHNDLNQLLYRLERNETFLTSYDDVAAAYPRIGALPLGKANFLLQLQRFEESREFYARAAKLLPDSITPHDGLAQSLAGLGEFDAAIREHETAVKMEPENVNAWCNFAQTLSRSGDAKKAARVAEQALRHGPFHQGALAIWGTALAQLGDSRHELLNDYENFVQVFDLEPPPGFADMAAFNAALNHYLDSLHTDRREFTNQTLRGGTQTIENLFGAGHAPIEALRARIDETVGRYIESLARNAEHPLLGRRAERFLYAGSWSSRLHDCGFHTNHVHPKGWISSAYYVAVPDAVADETGKQGWIKFGEPPFDAQLKDPVRRTVQPAAGRLVLFPSYMWHGTVPFHSGEARTTIAFDVIPMTRG
jgi:tetratricopeptide (TPR) repeat protein